MPVINVVKRFMLKDDNNRLTEYDVGKYDVEPDVAEHWYVKPHLEGYEPPAPQRGTAAFAEAEMRVAQAVRMGAGLPTPGGVPSSVPRDSAGAKPNVPYRQDDPAPFAVAGRRRDLPAGPDELQQFNDPRLMWPRSGESKSMDRANDPQRIGLDATGAGGGAGDLPSGNERPVPPASGESKSQDRAHDPQRVGDQPQKPGSQNVTPEQQKSWKDPGSQGPKK